ncbi:flagellar hook-length control protein FliK [Variovorax sp. KBW07]|uniref:flagellar hook-length control protein FliK n=1 Tax=Variovorax sp. KBW07 TaxID=2153358 RepID=UPI000F564395|nr:flagellar hook-length control protein FliK [Variovorax sp. KBW07]RQO51378.1 flagellar hook-length control protein FliK [Variovorax sp. KBW07]
MSGLAGLIDALLAARLTPRLDVLGIKPEATIGAPGPALGIGKLANDVRLPSNAALDRQLPATVSGGGGAGQHGAGAPASVATRLSVAARVIGAVLADLQAEPGPVRGAAPLWPSRQAANASAMAGTLAQAVSDSGMFYESHLAEFASGTRTLAQMAREPQARWSTPVAAQAAATAAATVPQATALALAQALGSAVLQDPAQPGSTQQQAPALAQDGNASGHAPRGANVGGAQQGMPGNASAQGGATSFANTAVNAANAAPASSSDAARVQAAYRQPDNASTGSVSDSASAHRASDAARQADTTAATPASREVIHPQAVTLVHQQLDLLASAAFRWSGQAWPDVPMSWSIEEEQDKSDERGGAHANADEDSQRRWSTTVSLVLPRLGEVDLRLSLTGPTVQAHLSAREATTMARMRGDAGQLAKRFEAAGLQLQQLQVTAKAAA